MKSLPLWLKITLWVLLVLIVLAGIVSFVLQRMGYAEVLKTAWLLKQRQELSVEDAKVLAQLKKIIDLPEDVTPTMAVVTDADALKKTQPNFFAKAKNGERLIIYPTIAILYDYQANKIIMVGPVQFNAQPIAFALYNGTSDNSKTQQLEDKLKKAFGNAEIKVRDKAAKTDYEQTLVIDLVGNNPDIQKIADAVGGKVGPLPQGEKKPEGVVVLIIIGKK